MYRKIMLFLALVWVFTACQNRPLQQLGATSISQKVDEYKLEGGGNVTVDILFVVDNSGSMAEEQEKVAQNIDNFMKMLKLSADAGKTDYHIGVITTSIYDAVQLPGIDESNEDDPILKIKEKEDGRLLLIKDGYKDDGECTISSNIKPGKRYLDVTDGNVVDLLKNTIKCTKTKGAGIERGFDAIERALSERITDGTNAGFLRDDAKLMIIVIGDEDDCSTGLRAIGSTDAPYPIPISRGYDCVEQSDLIPEANGQASTSSEQNKLKPVSYYYDFLLRVKGNDPLKLGFAAIVGPLNCWTGEISDIGQGVQTGDSSIPFSYLNCSYTSNALTPKNGSTIISNTMYELNLSSCQEGVTPVCDCSEEPDTYTRYNCKRQSDLFVTCFNNLEGVPNKIPIISTEACSENYLHGKCDDGFHCAVTDSGVKCVENSCSSTDLNGTCPADKTCDNTGNCIDKTPALYDTGKDVDGGVVTSKDDEQVASFSGYSQATAGKRFLELQKLVAAGNAKDSYKYAICLEDFGTPLSLIGARLADAKCEYSLENKTDAPCTVAINLFAPEDTKLENGTRTNLNSPWIYSTLEDCSGLTGELNEICEANKTRTFAEKGEALVQICKDNIDKPYSERIDISKLLEKVKCADEKDENVKECLFITFPDENNACPQPGSNVQIYYGVNE